MPCDVFIPAAVPDVITEEVATRLNCKYVVEAANGPTTPEGDKALRERGIVVLPDVYANGGEFASCIIIIITFMLAIPEPRGP